MTAMKTPVVGELRPSQIMFTYGVGALVDLPHISVLVTGLDDWTIDPGVTTEIYEERLLAAVRWQLGAQVQRLLTPPVAPPTMGTLNPFDPVQPVGIPVAPFPRWLLCPRCQLLAPISSGLFRR